MSTPTVNRQFTLKSRPVGMPTRENFDLIETPIPALKDGEVLVKAAYLSVDPYMRGRISGMKSYAAPVEIGQLMVGGAVAQVVESRNPKFAAGEIVDIYSGWQEYAISDGKSLRKLDPAIAPVSTALGILGMPGYDRIFRTSGCVRAESRRNGAGFGRGGRSGDDRRADRKNQGLPDSGDRGQRRQDRLPVEANAATTRPSITRRHPTTRRSIASCVPRGSIAISTMWAA